MKADLHIHTNYSKCSNAKIEDVLSTAQRKGLDIIAITDHNTIKGARIAKRINPYKDLKVIIGCEIKCEYGELLIYDIKKEIKTKKFLEILKQAREQKAKVFISHPIDFIRLNNTWKKIKLISSVDGIEKINGRNLFNFLTKKINSRGIAGSDAHYLEEIGNTYMVYKKDLWKEIMNNEVKFVHNNSFLTKLKYLIKSFLHKWF